VLKRQLTDLLGALGSRLVTAKGVGFEFTFGQRVDQIEESLPGPGTKEITAPPDARQIESVSELSQLPPPYIVSQAWLRLESAIQNLVDENLKERGQGDRHIRLGTIPILMLRKMNIFADDELDVLGELRELRNRAAHSLDPNITLTDALRYNDIANNLIHRIEERHKGETHYPANFP